MGYESDEGQLAQAEASGEAPQDNGSNGHGRVQSKRGDDPQDTLYATLKKSRKSENEILAFSYRISFFEIVFVVNLPDEDAKVGDRFPVYAKYKINFRRAGEDDRD